MRYCCVAVGVVPLQTSSGVSKSPKLPRRERTLKKSSFSGEQISGILRQQEAGASTADIFRRRGILSATFYKWTAEFCGMDVLDASA